MGFMTLEMSHEASLRSARKEGIQEGIELGKEQGLEQGLKQGIAQGEAIQAARYDALIAYLLDSGRVDDLKYAAEDPQFREQLFEELDL